MKICLNIIVILLAMLLMSCSTNDNGNAVEAKDFAVSPQLLQVDSLMWTQPDSALALLCRDAKFCVSTTTTFNRHYANLLLSELLYKNDYPQTNRPALRQAVSYFDSLVCGTPPFKGAGGIKKDLNPNLSFLSARAHYINGVGYYEHDSVVEACREYITALETMESHFEKKELVGKKAKFMSLTYTHLTGLFSNLYLHEQAICFGKEAVEYYQKYNSTPWHIAWTLNEIGSHYEMMDNYDSANRYYHKSLTFLSDTNNLMYRDIKTCIACLSYKNGEFAESSLYQLHQLLDMAESEKEYLSRCLSIGTIFYHEQQFDSAFAYLNNVYSHTNSLSSKKQAAEWLVEICKIQNKNSKILEYADFLVPYANMSENNSYLNSQLTEIYQCHEQNKIEIEHVEQMRKLKEYGNVALVTLAVLSIVVFIGLHFIHKRRHKHLKLQKKAVETQLESERYAHEIQKKAMSSKLIRSNEALRQTVQQLEEVKFSHKAASEERFLISDLVAFRSSPVCQHILEVVEDCNFKPKIDYLIYKNYALDKSQLNALVEAADLHLENFSIRIRKKYPALTDEDIKYCCLYLLELNEADVSALMQRAYSTVCERNRKIKRIMGAEKDLIVKLIE